MRYTTVFLVFCAWIAVLTTWVGCRQSTVAPPDPKESQPTIIGVSLSNTKSPQWANLKVDLEAAAAKRPNLRLLILDANGDADKQKRDLEEILSRHAKALIVVPVDGQAMTEPVSKLFDAGMPVIVLDKAVIGDKYTCYIAPDWDQIGEAVGVWLAEKLQGKGKIVEIKGPVDSIPADQLHDAFREQLRDPGYRFVFEGFLDPSRVDGAKLMAAAMADVDQFDAVFAFDDAAARAAYETAKSAGREKGVLFIGVGGLPDRGKKLVDEGILSASAVVSNGAAEAIDAAVKIIGGGKVPKKIVPTTRVIAD